MKLNNNCDQIVGEWRRIEKNRFDTVYEAIAVSGIYFLQEPFTYSRLE
jgi:hypothetical protein